VQPTELAVVGAGPAGIAAAVAASRAGARVTLLEESPAPGGQLYRQPPAAFRVRRPERLGKEYARAQQLMRELAAAAVAVRPATLVWGVEAEKTLLLYREGEGAARLPAEALVVATGAYDRPIAFPGWTLPGVWTAGGA
jgi:D-hydroxyproline dehydrogenase subunit alpha